MKNQLTSAHSKLSEMIRHGKLENLSINSCFIDPKRSMICVGVERDAKTPHEKIRHQLEEMLHVAVEVAFASLERHGCPDKTSECDPIWGGIQMEGQSGGTICLVTTDSANNVGFLVSSHVVGSGTGLKIGQPTTAKRNIGTVTINPTLDGRMSDSAFAKRSTSRINVEENKIWQGASTAYDVTAFQTSGQTPVNTPVAMQGATQPGLSTGMIQVLGVTTKDVDGTLTNQVLASYASNSGDSGAPVFSDPGTGTTVTFYGINVGTYNYNSVIYGWYSPTEGIRNDLGIPLT